MKISEPVIDAWSRILAAVPSARLVLGEANQRRFNGRIDSKRLLFVPRAARREYLQQYQHIDIALDPWPYNGHTTTCDALWMGVPVVSLAGQTSVARGGVSILSAIGLTELLAGTIEEYVGIAAGLAQDRPRLAELRSSLRPRLRKSPLMDAPGFTRDVEALYRLMWHRWCQHA
jgi:predicted O-linked N-acetylglucosamine transferase (SPINDLY family)